MSAYGKSKLEECLGSVLLHDLQSKCISLFGADLGDGDPVSVDVISMEAVDSSGNTLRRLEMLPLSVAAGNRPIVSSDFEYLRALEGRRSGNGSKND